LASDKILYETGDDGVARITLNDPDTRNALSSELLAELLNFVTTAQEDEAVRVIVFSSSHDRIFSSGANLAGFAGDTPLIHKQLGSKQILEIFTRIASSPKPTICAANGHVLAGALGLALACDLIVAKEGAEFGTPEINVGAWPFMVMALLYRNVPRKFANELILFGDRVSAQRAYEIGIVNRVVPADEFDAAVDDWAHRLASKSPLIMKLGKQAAFAQMDMSFFEGLEFLHSQLSLALSTEDIVEGVTAFFEKRDPVWKGR
jgi:enoyl-CoA hydratase/carnithine racemase